MSDDARAAMLARIRRAIADGAPRHGAHGVSAHDDAPALVRGVPLDAATCIARLVHRVEEYRAHVEVTTHDALPAAIAARVAMRGARTLVIPADLPVAWRPAGVALREDHALDVATLDAVDGVITGCRLAIAETGTIVLDGGAAQGRRAISLLPDWHCCVVFASQVVGDVPDAVRALAAAGSLSRPQTWISGPSATSDIELDRVEGVHGPRTLEVLVVRDA